MDNKARHLAYAINNDKPSKGATAVHAVLPKPNGLLNRCDSLRSADLGRLNDPTIKANVIVSVGAHNHFIYPEYNFSEVITIAETEPLVSRAFNRKEVMCLKQGWNIVGKNPKTVQYIKQRLAEIAHVSGLSTQDYITAIAKDFIWYSNHFVAVVRNKKLSSGKRAKIGGAFVDPIAGLFPIPAETVMLRHDTRGNIVEIAQELFGIHKRIEFKKHQFMHFKINELNGSSVGTPDLVPVKDDILALRRIEEDVELLLNQHLFPLYNYTVGTEDAPAQYYPDGTSEVQEVQRMWASIPSEGAIVMPERHKMSVLGASGSAIDANPYLEYFKKRVLAGLSISSLDIGDADTSNRSTSDSLSRILIDGVKYLQMRISGYFQHIINMLLLESTFDSNEVLLDQNIVKLEFNEIDVDHLIKMENHAAQMFTQHAITQSELRNALGQEPFSDEEFNDTYYKKIQEVLELLKSKQSGFSSEAQALSDNPSSAITPEQISKEQEAETKQAKAANRSGPSNTKRNGTSGQRAGANTNDPANQHGRSSDRLYDLILNDSLRQSPSTYKQQKRSIVTIWQEVLDHAASSGASNNAYFIYESAAIALLSQREDFNRHLIISAYDGMRDALANANSESLLHSMNLSKLFIDDMKEVVSKTVDKFLLDLKKKLNKNSDSLTKLDVANTLSWRLSLLETNELARSYALGQALAFRKLGYKKAMIKNVYEDSCSKCKVETAIDLYDMKYSDLPPVSHPNATQILEPISEVHE